MQQTSWAMSSASALDPVQPPGEAMDAVVMPLEQLGKGVAVAAAAAETKSASDSSPTSAIAQGRLRPVDSRATIAPCPPIQRDHASSSPVLHPASSASFVQHSDDRTTMAR